MQTPCRRQQQNCPSLFFVIFTPYHLQCLQVLKLNSELARNNNWANEHGQNASYFMFLKKSKNFLTNRLEDYWRGSYQESRKERLRRVQHIVEEVRSTSKTLKQGQRPVRSSQIRASEVAAPFGKTGGAVKPNVLSSGLI